MSINTRELCGWTKWGISCRVWQFSELLTQQSSINVGPSLLELETRHFFSL